MMRPFFTLFALSALAVALPAAAEPEPVQVLALQSDDAIEQAQAMTLALKNAAKQKSSFTLAPGDYSLEVLSLALGCPDTPDDACLAKIAAKIKADSFVWGTLAKAGPKFDLKLNLYRTHGASKATELHFEAKNDAAFARVAAESLSKLAPRPAHGDEDEDEERTGKLLLSADDLEGEIVIDGAPAGEIHDGHAELELPVGEHDVSVRADGYHDTEGSVTVTSDKRALLRLHPEKFGTHHDASGTESEDSGGSESNASAGWGAIIVGGAFAVAGIYATVRVNSINHDPDFDGYRAGIPKGDDACDEANRNVTVPGGPSPSRISDLCSQSKTFAALQYVFFGLGAVAAGTGAVILLTDDKSAPPKSAQAARHHEARFDPSLSLGSHSAKLDLRFRF
ncbi:MAG TPA: hypothetical protein VHV51_24075 [Polyangiaceae bacterium]|jgi:hypothetical protein|nr:hypothetical protein [Polyangiaceae bacterium]